MFDSRQSDSDLVGLLLLRFGHDSGRNRLVPIGIIVLWPAESEFARWSLHEEREFPNT